MQSLGALELVRVLLAQPGAIFVDKPTHARNAHVAERSEERWEGVDSRLVFDLGIGGAAAAAEGCDGQGEKKKEEGGYLGLELGPQMRVF